MKMIQSMLVAIILSLYTFCTSCWYAPSIIFGSVMPFVFVALSRVSSGRVRVCHVQVDNAGCRCEWSYQHYMTAGEQHGIALCGICTYGRRVFV